MTIRRMRQQHTDRIAELEKLCFAVPWSKAMVESELRSPVSYYLVMEDGGTVIAYAGMQVILDEGYITNIACDPAHRRKGAAKALLAALLDESVKRGLSFLTLEVRRSNAPAQGLYASFGFELEGVRAGYYTNPQEDALLMTLRFGHASRPLTL